METPPTVRIFSEVSAMIFHLSKAYFEMAEGSLYDHRVMMMMTLLTTGLKSPFVVVC